MSSGRWGFRTAVAGARGLGNRSSGRFSTEQEVIRSRCPGGRGAERGGTPGENRPGKTPFKGGFAGRGCRWSPPGLFKSSLPRVGSYMGFDGRQCRQPSAGGGPVSRAHDGEAQNRGRRLGH